MIIQKVIKGIGGITNDEALSFMRSGITCHWWHLVNPLPNEEIPQRLNERNLIWHQNHYDTPDPQEGGRPFNERTPFISTTAGTVERDALLNRNVLIPAWFEALYFATDAWRRDGYLFFCYVFILGKRAIGHQQFAEELRELNVYNDYSPFQPEGEITAKIIIPPTQIERVELWSMLDFKRDINAHQIPQPAANTPNPLYLPPENYNNVRDILS
ncbi:MAG TPA: hypothetical protein VMF88_10740 [Bacteroidota bacterium]|nr:hypothetical protein [Bacteroidota bacterium]